MSMGDWRRVMRSDTRRTNFSGRSRHSSSNTGIKSCKRRSNPHRWRQVSSLLRTSQDAIRRNGQGIAGRQEKDQEKPKATIGALDPAMRKYIQNESLLFSVPASRFVELSQNIKNSFADNSKWLKLIENQA